MFRFAKHPGATAYDKDFFAEAREVSLNSARVVAPILISLVHPTTVIDVGCGLGGWLLAFQECGVSRVAGIDGEYIDRSKLLVNPSCFTAADLSGSSLTIQGKYDLALCLEVAEHLPSKNSQRLVEVLTDVAPVVLFSAAVPGQGGTSHVNEQWPSYWRDRFEARGFQLLDAIRPIIREDSRVAWYYRQNLLLFATPEAIRKSLGLQKLSLKGGQPEIEWVHVGVVASHRSPMSIFRLMRTALFTRLKS